MSSKTIGIMGGMGPEATLRLYRYILDETPANKDQEHLRTIIFSNPRIPDRTQALIGVGKSPVPEIVSTARQLHAAGADFIIVPSVSAHYFLNEIENVIPIPFLSIIDITIRILRDHYPEIARIGLLSSDGVIEKRLFHDRLEKVGVEVITPMPQAQKEFIQATVFGERGIKAGWLTHENKRKLIHATQGLQSIGAQAILIGCTEISLLLDQEDVAVPLVDSLMLLAKAAVHEAAFRA